MEPVLICLDSGTTAVKAAAFDARGRMIAQAECANGALRRDGLRVEQDMDVTRQEALAVLRDCVAQLGAGTRILGCILTGQGDGLWPLDRDLQPVGRAMTWLDGRAGGLVAAMAPALDRVQALTGSRPTAASASLQLLWLQRHMPQQFARIAHALRLKEWLFVSLTGRVMGEPTAALPVWGDWRSGALLPAIPEALGLTCGLSLLPEFMPVGACRAGLTPQAAAATGLPQGVPVLMGPGDVQATLVGLGLGSRAGVSRASIFGTSAIHACLRDDPALVPDAPAGAMVQQFAHGGGYLCFHPAFNGATVLHHLSRQFAGLPAPVLPDYSALILHPFLEPGGERAPWTDPHASGALFGLTAAATPSRIAWAGREALAFVTRKSHMMMGAGDGALSLGGGLAGDGHFAAFLAEVMGCEVQRSPGGHAGLRGLAAIGARFLLDAGGDAFAPGWIGAPEQILTPKDDGVRAYAMRKYDLFNALVDAAAPFWGAISDLRAEADILMEVQT